MQRSAPLRIIISAALICSVIIFVPASSAGAGGNSWHWVNPEPTGDTINAVSMSPYPNGSTCLWAVGEYGLIQKTFDYGNSWHKFDPQGMTGTPTLNDIDLLADSLGWAVGENGTIVKINPEWQVSVQTPPAEAVGKTLYAVDALGTTTAFAVGEGGLVIKTTNGGTTWVTVSANVAGLNDFRAVVALSDTQCLVAGIGNGGASNNDVFFFDGSLYYNKSTPDVNFSAEDMAFDPASNTLWVVGKNKNTQAPLHYWVADANVDLANNDTLFYAPTPPMPTATGYLTGISRLDATHTWVTTTQGELLFYDGTNPWVEDALPYENAWLNDVSFRKTPGGQYEGAIVGDRGAMAATEDGGANWSTRSSFSSAWLPSVDFVSQSTGYIVSNYDVLMTSDTGQSWSKLGNTGSTSLLDVDFKDATHGCVVGRSGSAYIYSGTAWTAMSGMSPGRDLYSVSYVDSSNIWACGDVGTIAKWSGTSWQLSGDPDVTSGLWRSIDFFDASHGIAVGDGGVVAYTTDGGADWKLGDSGVLLNTLSVDMVSANVGYLVGGDGSASTPVMRKTVDGGLTWTQMTSPVTWKAMSAVAFADANNGWIVGLNGLILQTTNGGSTWTLVPQFCSASLGAVAAVAPGAAWAVGDMGAMLSTYWPPAPPAKTVVYRLYNMVNGTHFYTSSADEKYMILKKWPLVYKYEGVGYEYDALKADTDLHRLYNKKTGSHFYTSSWTEAMDALKMWPTVFTYEGPAYRVSKTPIPSGGTVFRFYNLKNGSHFFTADPAERDMVIAKWPNVFSYEGPAFYLPQ